MDKAVDFVQAKVDEFGWKLSSFDGKVTKRLQIINPSEAVGKNIDEIESIKGYKIITPKNGIKHLRREKGMTDKLEKLSVNKDGIIIKIEEKSIRNVPNLLRVFLMLKPKLLYLLLKFLQSNQISEL